MLFKKGLLFLIYISLIILYNNYGTIVIVLLITLVQNTVQRDVTLCSLVKIC